MRKRVRSLACGMCQQCNANGKTKAGDEVDHIVPVARGGDERLTNLTLLCRECHHYKTRQERMMSVDEIRDTWGHLAVQADEVFVV